MSAPEPVVRLTRTAERDLGNIAVHARREWSADQHRRYRAAIDRALRRIRDHPRSGRPRDDLFPGCRTFRVGQHVIYYHQPDAATIVVRRILHSRQDVTTAVKESDS